MDIGIFSAPATVDDAVDTARTAHEQGFAIFGMPQIFGLDALTTLAVIASEVPEIRLATGVVPTYRQHPMMMAQQALTVNQVSEGRLSLGIGLSHQIVVEGMWGLSFERPLRHMREFLDVLMPLLEGEAVNADGETIVGRGQLDVRAPRPEVLIAALGPKMLSLAGARADGTATWMVGPKTLVEHVVPTISEAAAAADRPEPVIAVSLPVCVTDDVAAARDRAAKEFEMYGHLPSYAAMLERESVDGPADVAMIGSADEVIDALGGLADAGTTTYIASEFGTAAEREATREVLTSLL